MTTMDAPTISDANRLGLSYREEAGRLPFHGPIWDVHTHIHGVEAAKLFIEAADVFHVEHIWSMNRLEDVDPMRDVYGDRFQFIAVPDYRAAKENPDTFTTDWLRRIEGFAAKGAKVCKFWAAPRGRDLHESALLLDSPIRRQGMDLARQAGMIFMTHVADPDTWFATHYKDASRYGEKMSHYEPFERLLEEYHDVPWIAAHMAGHPEDLDHLQGLLDRHPNLYLDTSATKWMVRELSKRPVELRAFCERNRGRILFGSDIVANAQEVTFDLLASRYWALRTLFETCYDGPSPIVDPDLSMVDPSLPRESTARLRGAKLDDATLKSVYHGAARELLAPLYGWRR